jgi:hypothetical protein
VGQNVGAVNQNVGAVSQNVGSIDPMTGQAARNEVQDALMQRLAPQMNQDRDALQTQMRNQGIAPGTDAWRAGMDDYSRSANDARLAVIADAGQELDRDRNWANTRSNADRAWALDTGDRDRGWAMSQGDRDRNWAMTQRGMSNEDRQRALSEMLLNRQQPMNELLALATGQFGPTAGGGGGGGSVQPVDMTSLYGMQQANQQQAYQGRVANVNSNNQAAAGAVTAIAMAAALA